ncbi:MAG: TonB-dependent receptor [Treponema sp.]|nr:TonB-dependent receptor [Treponema sp.]
MNAIQYGDSHRFLNFLRLPAPWRLLLLPVVLWFVLPLGAEEAEFTGDEPPEAAGITVVASPETTQQMRVITREEIEAAHAPDLAVLLQETANLALTRYGPYGNQTDINMRGFDSERIAFLINGVPVNSPVTGDFDISMIDLNTVDRIEVIYGGSDSKYNVTGALGGLINIITVKERERGLRVGGSFSNTAALPGKHYKPGAGGQGPKWQDLADSQNMTLSLGLGTEKSSWSAGLFANRAGNHFLFKDYYGRILRREGNEVWDAGASLSLVRNLARGAKLIAGGDLYYGDKNIPPSGISTASEKQRDVSTRQNLMLDIPGGGDSFSVEASLSHVWQSLDYGASSSHDFHTLSAINRWAWYPLDRLTLRLGGDYRYSRLKSSDMGLRGRHDGGLYVTGEFQSPGRLLIIPSLKAVFSGTSAAPVTPVPKLGLLWEGPSLTVKNNYFRSFKFPDFEDLYWAGGGMYGNADLKPEDGWGMDLGAAWKPVERIDFEGTFFTQWTADSIHWYGSGGIWRPENVGEAVFFGLDLKARLEIPLGRPAGGGPFERIGFSLSYQPLLSYLLSYGYGYSSNKRIPYMPPHSAAFSIDIPWKAGASGASPWRPSGSLAVSGHYQGFRYSDTANIGRLRPYFLLNASVNQEINRNLSAFLVLRNILNRSYESFNDYYLPGLTASLGLRVKF